ncbi:histone-lysine N-methyltransferase SETMAR-like [Venturia canescens]|uniref:histone-lysine N-methyltransferase SETMAR-like n=1 Tax=Venturia canescens TaxID=32260 RepID=UPI001C9BDF0E|nr:histone-lysine N-methyltransferase SETMAR-like [Venturia canescens]
MEQRAAIKCCFKLGKSGSETYQMLKTAYGEDCLSRSKVFEWYGRFKNGRESLEDDPREGRPSTSTTDDNVERVRTLVASNPRVSVETLSRKLNISVGSVYHILHDVLGKKKICAKFVPHSLTLDQKQWRLDASLNFLDWANTHENFLNKIVTGDETWCFQYDPTTKRQSAEWRSQEEGRPLKVRATKSKIKTMFISFFDSHGIIHSEFVPTGQTVNAAFYKDVLDRLLKRIRRIRPELYSSGDWFLLHDNAPSHSSILVSEFLTKKSVTVIRHPPYSPDLAPADFFLFPKIKIAMKGERFQDVEAIKRIRKL